MPDKKEENKIGKVKQAHIVEEMRNSYIDYAMSVIVSRALPDIRDGLKPVHRRILYAMKGMGLTYSSGFRKSAAVTGEVLGKYHPHGDASVYDALVRMSQDFSLRYPLVVGQGNFGCFTKNTKIRLCDGRSLSFGKLIEEQKKGKRHWTFTFNTKSKKIEISEIKKPRLTRRNEEIMEVTLDNGKKIKCTLDHKFMLRNGKYREAQKLKSGDSLMPFYSKRYDGRDKNLKEYEMAYQPVSNRWEFTHRLADKWNLDNKVYTRKAGRIRHHKDFNKFNNNPDNILRIQWQDHWKYHKEIASRKHKEDPEYVRKLAEGRKKFWSKKENREKRSKIQAERNKKMWKNPEYRKKWIKARKEKWKDPEYKNYMRKVSSKNLKSLWQSEDFQRKLSELKSKEMRKRWKDRNYRKYQAEKTRKLSFKIWSDPKHRDYMSKLMKKRSKDPLWKKERSRISKELWQDSEYRSKYEKEHFKKMARKLWNTPGIKEFHREKARKQWQDSSFRKKVSNLTRERNLKRIEKNPGFMENLTQKAKASLEEKWKDPEYKEKVMRSKILNYVHNLLKEYSKVTPKIYDEERLNNGIPRAENALNYFEDFSDIVEQSKKRNHKVIKTKILKKREDVYDLTTAPWHNFLLDAGVFVHNSIDGDPAAAQRYTECKLSKLGEEMLKDIEKDTVDFMDNYDGTQREPTVLPSPMPQFLLNGSIGIAVGMATSIPPHNLTEVCDAAIFLIDNPKAATEDLFEFVKGPDFPTGGIIYGKKDIISAYSQGKGPIVSRGKAEVVENKKKRDQILITEIPYQVQKSSLVEQIAKLIQDKKIKGVKDVRDESDRDGLRIAIDLQQNAYPRKILNRLYKFTDLQKTFHLNMLALVDGIQPRVLSLVDALNYFIEHRKEVVYRRTKYDLERAKERAHILEGLHKCLNKIDDVIKTIKSSENRDDAQKKLMKKFKLTEIQANAILETKLSALAKLERKKIEDELKELKSKIKEYEAILKSKAKIKTVVKKELKEIKENFGDERRTKVNVQKLGEIAEEDLIPQEETVVTLTKGGYIKRVSPSTYKIQKRGGKGILGMKTLQEDIVEHFLIANTHDSLLFFTDSGKVFRTVAYEIPSGSRVARGRGIQNFLELSSEEKVLSLQTLGKEDKEKGIENLIMVTKNGIIKKTSLEEFKNVRRSGLIAMKLRKGDSLRKVSKSTGDNEIIITTKKGKSIRFNEKDLRAMGRPASGVKGINLKKGDEVVGMDVIFKPEKKKKDKRFILIITENGYGKQTSLEKYREQTRGGMGIKTANINKKTGDVVSSRVLSGEEKEIIVISQKGQVIRTKVSYIPKTSRATQGVKIMRLSEGDKVASVACI